MGIQFPASRSAIAAAMAALLLGACGSGSSAPVAPGAEPSGPTLELLRFEQAGNWEVRRDEPLVLVFSDAIDPGSIRPGTIQLMRRSGLVEIPVTVDVDGNRLRLTPPAPFGLEPEARYELTVEGFPAFRAPLSLRGIPLRAAYRGSFSTNRFYQPDLIRPVLSKVELDEEPGDHWSVRLVFSEPVDPLTVGPGTVAVRDDADGRLFAGRYIHDRSAVTFRFLPDPARRPLALRVTLEPGIRDLAGNALGSDEPVERVLVLPPVHLSTLMGEIVEDFTTDEMLVAEGTTALWNDPSAPGALLGRPTHSILRLATPNDDETLSVPLGPGPVRIRMVITSAELGEARELTGLAWKPAGSWVAAARYESVFARITPTRRNTPDEPGVDLGPSITVIDRTPYDIDAGGRDLLALPFARSYTFDGRSNLLLDLRIGAGDRTNFLRVGSETDGSSSITSAAGTSSLRPYLAIRGFSMEPGALSRFYDSGSDSPQYFEPVVSPSVVPHGVTMDLFFQGARILDADGIPSAGGLSEWTDDAALLDGYRYLRFRVRFRGLSFTGDEPLIDDLRIPFRR